MSGNLQNQQRKPTYYAPLHSWTEPSFSNEGVYTVRTKPNSLTLLFTHFIIVEKMGAMSSPSNPNPRILQRVCRWHPLASQCVHAHPLAPLRARWLPRRLTKCQDGKSMEAKRTGKLKENPDNPCGPSRPADYAHSLTPHNDPVFEGGCLGAIRSPSRWLPPRHWRASLSPRFCQCSNVQLQGWVFVNCAWCMICKDSMSRFFFLG